jgi:hypothetical protein
MQAGFVRWHRIGSDLPQVERIAASGYVVLYLSLPGVVVIWFVTASARQEKRQVSYL